MATYRLKIDLTYTTTANATTATTNIDNVLAAQGRPERATRTNAAVWLQVDGLTEAQAVTLRNALVSAWGSTARSGGKVSTVRRPD